MGNKIYSAVDADECKKFIGWKCAFGDRIPDVKDKFIIGELTDILDEFDPSRFVRDDGSCAEQFIYCRPLEPPKERKYRPFRSIEEWREHCNLPPVDEIKSFRIRQNSDYAKGSIKFLTAIVTEFDSGQNKERLGFDGGWFSFKELFDNYTLIDGTPFGVLEEQDA